MAKDDPTKPAQSPANQQPNINLTLSVDLEIGGQSIPLTTVGGIENVKFSYDKTNSDKGDIIFSVSTFCDTVGINKDNLPASLSSLSIRIDTIEVDVKAKYYEFSCEIGKKDAASANFTSSWTPISEFDDFKLTNVKLDVARGTKPVEAQGKTDGGSKT